MTPSKSNGLLCPNRCWIAILILAFAKFAFPQTSISTQQLQPEAHRKVVQKVAPSYPPIAKTLKLTGMVRLAIKVAPNGKVMSAEVVGGHPVLSQVAVNAVLQWRYEAAAQQTDEVAAVSFGP